MKISTIIFIVALSVIGDGIAGEHLQEPRSPLLTTDQSQGGMKGIWIPDSYGGVTGVVLDLSRVGTNEMLHAFWQDEKVGQPHLGENFKIHSDETTAIGDKGKCRRVILVDSDTLQDNRKRVICYTAKYDTEKFDESGRPLSSEATRYSLTISEIKDDLEVIYLLRFDISFPNSKHPNLVKPPKREQDGADQPATAPELKSEGDKNLKPESEGRSQ